MKTLLAICILSCAIFGQAVKTADTKEQSTSKLEQFTARSGGLIEKTFVPVGDFSGIKVEIFKVNDLIAKLTITGVRLSKTVVRSYSSDEKTAVLDSDEVDGLIKSIELLKSNAFGTTRDSYTEIVYTARGGFSAGAFYNDSKWRAFVKLEKYDSNSSVFMAPEELDKLYALLVQAKASLK